MSDTEMEDEQELAALARAPRVTLSQVESRIRQVQYVILPDGRTTICMLTLLNGFTVRGESSCVSVENFNKELGERYSYNKAKDKIWELEAYLLAEHLYRGEIG